MYSDNNDNIVRLLVVLALSAFAISEPILTIFGANPEIFHFYNIETFSLLFLYAITIALLPPLSAWLIVAATTKVSSKAGLIVYYVVLGFLAGLWVIQLAKWSLSITHPYGLLALALCTGGAFVFAYVKSTVLRSCLKIAAVAPVFLVGNFLFFSQAGSVIYSAKPDATFVESDAEHPNVLFILLDEFPTLALLNEDGELDKIRYPNLAKFTEQGTWYRHYSVLSGKTDTSVQSILGGTYPRPKAARYANFPNNLFSLLAPTHHLTAFESITSLCGLPECGEGPPDQPVEEPAPEMTQLLYKSSDIWGRRISLTSSDGARLDDFQGKITTVQNAAEKVEKKSPMNAFARLIDPANQVGFAKAKPERLNKFIAALTPSDSATLYFLHLELPHVPWRFYANGQTYDLPYSNPPLSPLNDQGGTWIAKISEYRLLQQAQYTDLLLEEVFSRLKTLGMWDETLVIVTADHGRSFELNTNSRTIVNETIDSIAYAPLFVKRPFQQQGGVDDSNVIAVDVLPTLADIIGVNIPWKLHGFAIGDPRITRRGDNKVIFPAAENRQFFSRKMKPKQLFSDTRHFPHFSTRHVGALEDPENPLELLYGDLGISQYIGQPVPEAGIALGGPAKVSELEQLRRPATGRPPMGVVMGHLQFDPVGEVALISINGRFVSASPLFEFKDVKHTFAAMLPVGALSTENEIGVFLIDDNQLIALDLE